MNAALEFNPETWDRAAGVYREIGEKLSGASNGLARFDENSLCPGGAQTVADIAIGAAFSAGCQFFIERCGDVHDILSGSATAMNNTAETWRTVEAQNTEEANRLKEEG